MKKLLILTALFFIHFFAFAQDVSSGNITTKEEGEYNKKGNKIGEWKILSNGKLLGIETYVDGEKTEGKSFYENGQLMYIEKFKNGKLNGERKVYHRNGQLKTVENLKDGKEIGEWKIYFNDGQLQRTIQYDDKGDAIGEWKWYHPNGKLQSVQNYENGKATKTEYYDEQGNKIKTTESSINVVALSDGEQTNGTTYITHKNGKLAKEGKYDSKGKETGEWKFYTPNEDLESIGQYLNGEKNGKWNNFYPNGKILKTGSYENGKRTGEWKTYHPNGQLASVETYIDGKQIGKTELYNQQGESTTPKALDNEIKELMKAEFQEFCTSLQQKNFDQAINFVSADYLNATRFSKDQMKNMLQSNFDNWEILPDLNVVLKEIETQKPKKIIKQANKLYGVLAATMYFEMTVTGNFTKKEITETIAIIETIGKDRYKIGEIAQKENATVIQLTDKRLVASIYDEAIQKVSFAMAEMGLSYSFEKFLPKEIVEELKSQL